MNEDGYVCDLDLAKSILIMYFSNKFIFKRGLCPKIKDELVEFEGGFTFLDGDHYNFGGPDQMSGYVIQTLEGCLKEYEECPSMSGAAAYLNTFDVVFYEIEGEIKCFVLKELD